MWFPIPWQPAFLQHLLLSLSSLGLQVLPPPSPDWRSLWESRSCPRWQTDAEPGLRADVNPGAGTGLPVLQTSGPTGFSHLLFLGPVEALALC